MNPRSLVLLSVCVGCGTSPVAVCAGNHAGTFDGSDIGTLEATLSENGRAEVTMSGVASGTFTSSGKLKRDGTIEASGPVTIDGALDLTSCESEGTWTGPFGVNGTWRMALQ